MKPTSALPGAPRRALALALAALCAALALAPTASAQAPGAGGFEEGSMHSPFDRQGMWIWYVSHSEGGSIPAIVGRAKANGIGTVYVKSGDGATVWNQFNETLVARLHRRGLDVCAWQFVYGDHPAAEAEVGATAVRRGADCLVIDAEAEYEGKYASADLYIRRLRAQVGADYPLSLAGFPYVDYHPAFPYSVFLGPEGAQVNQPQMYWKAIGTSVRGVFEHTYLYNRIWGAPVYPIGQTYEAPGIGQLRLFRRFSASFGGRPPSWWDWQETTGAEWGALGARAAARPLPDYHIEVVHPTLKIRDKGDMVVWAQELLVGNGDTELPVTGIYGRQTRAAVRAFQEEHELPKTGVIATETWAALTQVEPYRVPWAASIRERPGARASLAGSPGSSRAAAPSRPLSAGLPPVADELADAPH